MKSVLVTGGAGFIGSHLVDRLLKEGWQVTVVDNFDLFYSPAIKRQNIANHLKHPNYTLVEADIRDYEGLRKRLSGEYDVIVHLAAKAGVRPSFRDPLGYYEVNVRGTQNMLELARKWGVRQFVFASSSSVYGVNPNVPWREDDPVLRPISPYAASKVAGELLGHVYSHLYDIRFIALRLFTVYGPRQRPDLAIYKFARLMLAGKPLPIYGDGTSRRDYTYIDDVVEGIWKAIDYTGSKYEVVNLGSGHAVGLLAMIRGLEEILGVTAKLEYLPPQPGDVPQTWADTRKAERLLGWQPKTILREGLRQLLDWVRTCEEV
ncbi:GDP-mannose 4,6-dehydratase [uncultured Thermanaerothrix sp.]|uniref:GDP-mannose 4,6-dehydratase n=1 Tax=uncultured Thermanaerothrix sp. TaxID=1195149 RepID=UPI00261F8E2B|nr:GDP-mannose 4,6-dehydratase [uncultured Thermanaerothrix sp.]